MTDDDESSGIDAVRRIMDSPEDVSLPDGMGADPGDYADHDAYSPAPPDAGAPDPYDPARDCAGLPLNDHGNGQRFIEHFGRDVIWVPRVGWFVWSGMHWQQDPDEIAVRRHAQRLGALIEQEIPHLVLEEWQMRKLGEGRDLRRRAAELDEIISRGGDQAEPARAERSALGPRLADLDNLNKVLTSLRKDHRGFARTSGNTARIQAAMTESSVGLARGIEQMDAAALDVNCETGLLRFSVDPTGDMGFGPQAKMQHLDHDRDHLMTKLMPVAYQEGAQAPSFIRFLERIQPDPEMRGFLQRWFGLSMTALTGEQKLCFFHGGGGNGKSVLVDLIARIMGDYASTAKIESLTGRNRRGGGDATPDLIPLVGARLVRASEPDEGEKLQEGLIKELTGGEPIMVRALNKDFFEIKPHFKLTISGNHKPDIRGLDDGIWRRVLLVPFDIQIPKAERDPTLGEKLWQERSGILNWMIDGLLSYLQNGLREPAAVLDATREYREESDPIGMFLDSACIVTGDPADSLPSKDLVLAFNFWMDQRGDGQWKDRTVSLRLKEKTRGWRSAVTGKGFTDRKSSGIMRYDGIRFSDLFKKDLPTDVTGRVTWKGARNG